MKEIIVTNNAPKAIGPYSQGVKANGFIFLSGQIPLDKDTGEMLRGNVAEQAELVLRNITALLKATGSSIESVIKTTIYLTDMNDFAVVNELYGRHFNVNPPARSCVEVSALPKGAMIEIEVIAEEK